MIKTTNEELASPSNPPADASPAPDDRLPQAERIVHKNVLWSMGAGILPTPILDVLAISGVQIKMLRELSELYGVTFMENKVKNIIAALIGGLGADYIGKTLAFSLFKLVPGFGHAAALLSIPIAAGGFTYAVGKTFIIHFESGGTFLDFDAAKVKDSFVQKFQEGKTQAKKLKTQPAAA